MTYQVLRNGQMYGPYTLEDLQRYVASGNVLPTDMAKSERDARLASCLPDSRQRRGTAAPVYAAASSISAAAGFSVS